MSESRLPFFIEDEQLTSLGNVSTFSFAPEFSDAITDAPIV